MRKLDQAKLKYSKSWSEPEADPCRELEARAVAGHDPLVDLCVVGPCWVLVPAEHAEEAHIGVQGNAASEIEINAQPTVEAELGEVLLVLNVGVIPADEGRDNAHAAHEVEVETPSGIR